MGRISKLAGDTAVYGLGTMVPRLLNFGVLTPYYTRIFQRAEYGIITELYAYIVVLQVILTYGLETGYFRFSSEKEYGNRVYSTALISLAVSSSVFMILVYIFGYRVANALEYKDHVDFIIWFSWIVAIDAFTSLPFAKLRRERKAFKFSIIKIVNVAVTIALVFIFFELFPRMNMKEHTLLKALYSKDIGVGYVFIANLVASVVTLLLLMKEILSFQISFDWNLYKRILVYSLPLLLAGLAGILNEALDRILLKHLLPDKSQAMAQLGLYGANYKIAVFMSLFIQMFRYAADPFFFSNMNNTDAKLLYARVMNYFVMFCSFIYLGIILNLDIAKFFIGRNFHEGLFIVPIVLMANWLLGVYFNLSIWYKLNNKTLYGAVFMLIGAIITVLGNIIFVPIFGIAAAACCHLLVYSVLVVLSYIIGQRNYSVPYNVRKLLIYIILPVLITIGYAWVHPAHDYLRLLIGNAILITFVTFALWNEGVLKEVKCLQKKFWYVGSKNY